MHEMTCYQAPGKLLDDKIILLTGAAGGIGEVVADAYARHGAQLILLDKNSSGLKQLDDRVSSNESLHRPVLVCHDLARLNYENFEQLAEEIDQKFGRVDGILHNAAELPGMTPMEHYTVDNWFRVLHVNLHAAYLLTRACFPLIKKSERASILFTSSDIGKQSKAYGGAFGVGNCAVEGMMKIWAGEQGRGSTLRFNSVNPGVVATAMRAKVFPGDNPKDLTQAEQLVPAYLYLMGDESVSLNGQSIDLQ